MAYQGTYTFIPPPPLLEFYTKKQKDSKVSSSTSCSTEELNAKAATVKETPMLFNGAYDGRPRVAAMTQAPFPAFPSICPRPLTRHDDGVPPLAVYHICRMCLRPRSPRYHKEHPIPIDGLPPPPGICRRCRVTTVEETKRVAEVVKIGESNEIKLGFITPFVSEDAIISNEEMRAKNAEKHLRNHIAEQAQNRSRNRSQKDIIYRHVKVVDEPKDTRSNTQAKIKFTSRSSSTTSDGRPLPEPPIAPKKAPRSMQAQPTEHLPAISTEANGSGARSGESSFSKSSSAQSSTSSSTTTKVLTLQRDVKTSECTDSDIRRIAREEVERYKDEYWKLQRSEASIRKIAREEVERYREAERKLEAHPDPYAHGRLVPVNRHIEQARDDATPMPWTQAEGYGKEEVLVDPEGWLTSKKQLHGKDAPSVTISRKEDWNLPAKEISFRRYRETHHSSGESPIQGQNEGPALNANDADGDQGQALREELARNNKSRAIRTSRARSHEQHMSQPARIEFEHANRNDQSDIAEAVKERLLPQERARAGPLDREWAYVGDGRKEAGVAIKHYELHKPLKVAKEPLDGAETKTWSTYSGLNVGDGWNNGNGDPTKSERSTKRYEATRVSSTATESRQGLSHETEGSPEKDSGQFKPDHGNLNGMWTEETFADASSQRSRTKHRPAPPYPEHETSSGRIVWPPEASTDRAAREDPSRKIRPDKDDQREYLYAERIIQPADRPLGRRPFDDHRPRHVEVEEIVEYRRIPPSKSKKAQQEGHSREERSTSRGDSERLRSSTRSCKGNEGHFYRDPSQGGRDPLHQITRTQVGGEQEQATHNNSIGAECRLFDREEYEIVDIKNSNHVRFSKKVDISPTPPDSDASSSEFRSYHSVERQTGTQTDGNHSPDQKRDQIREYERGKGHIRNPRADHGRLTDRIATVVNDRIVEPCMHHIAEAREDLGEVRKNVGDTARKIMGKTCDHTEDVHNDRDELKSGVEQRSRREGRLMERHGKLEDEQRDRRKGKKQLARALSESPSREGSLASFNLGGRGPYRPDQEATDSMRAEDGSSRD